MRGFEIVDGAAVGDWIQSELTGGGGSVTGNVPARYDAYVRILHPASLNGEPVTWGQVADEIGRTVHPLAQWDAIVGANRYRGEKPDWPGTEPEWGSLDPSLLGALVGLLGGATETSESSYFGIWNGFGWGRVSTMPPGHAGQMRPDIHRSTDDLSFAFSKEETGRPPLRLPHREYTVLAGPLTAAVQIEGWLSPSSPNLLWPKDRAWFVTSEIDFDSTLVGGTDELAQRIIEDERFEAFEVGPGDLLTWDADTINPPLLP